jgi:hypothetical protein
MDMKWTTTMIFYYKFYILHVGKFEAKDVGKFVVYNITSQKFEDKLLTLSILKCP